VRQPWRGCEPHAGLLFVDFEAGHTLQISGTARVLWDPRDDSLPKTLRALPESERAVVFEIEQVVEREHAWPFVV